MKERMSVSLEEDVIKTISKLVNKTGLSKSYIINKWILEGLRKDGRLTSSERYFFSKRIILETIESLFVSMGFEPKTQDIHNSLVVLLSLPRLCFDSDKQYNLFRISIFEVMDKIHIHDRDLFVRIINSMKELSMKEKISSEISEDLKKYEISEDLKSSELSRLPASGTDVTNNTISVTELEDDEHGES